MTNKRNNRRIAMWAALAAVLLLAAGARAQDTNKNASQSSSQAAASDRAADDAAIRAAVNTFTNGWNTHDAHAMTTYVADDVEWVAWSGGVTHGRAAVEAGHHEEFADIYKNTHRVDTIRSIHYLGPELASVDFTWTMTGAKRRDGSDWPYRAGYVNWVMARRDGRWIVVISHTADANAKAPAGTAVSANQ